MVSSMLWARLEQAMATMAAVQETITCLQQGLEKAGITNPVEVKSDKQIVLNFDLATLDFDDLTRLFLSAGKEFAKRAKQEEQEEKSVENDFLQYIIHVTQETQVSLNIAKDAVAERLGLLND